PARAPIRPPTYDRELWLLECARFIAQTYEGNPRNYEDTWYLFWLQFFRIWTYHLVCDCMPSAQYSVWTKLKRYIHNVLEQIDLSNLVGRTSATGGTRQNGIPVLICVTASAPYLNLVGDVAKKAPSQAVVQHPDEPVDGHPDEPVDKPPDKVLPDHEPQPDPPSTGTSNSSNSSGQQTELGETTQRVPDTCLVAFHIPKLTMDAARKLIAKRLETAQSDTEESADEGESQVAASSRAAFSQSGPLDPTAGPSRAAPLSSASQEREIRPHVNASLNTMLTVWIDAVNAWQPDDLNHDPIRSAMPSYRAEGLHKDVTQFKMVCAEHKGGASRETLKPNKYENKELNKMDEAQRGSANQGRIYLSHCQRYSSQTEVLLIATVDDNWTHSVMRRITGSENFKVQMEPWSRSVIVGSPSSDAREAALIDWINERFPKDLGPLAKESRARRRQSTPDSDAGSDQGDETDGPDTPAQGTKKGRKKRRNNGGDKNTKVYNLRARETLQKPAEYRSSTRTDEAPPPKRRRIAVDTTPASRKPAKGGTRATRQSTGRTTRSATKASNGASRR
ncbi:hypothetical protein EV122DRAFT_226793, partial [Schizophyllum commune]